MYAQAEHGFHSLHMLEGQFSNATAPLRVLYAPRQEKICLGEAQFSPCSATETS